MTAGSCDIGDFVACAIGDGVCDCCAGCGCVATGSRGFDLSAESPSSFSLPELFVLAWVYAVDCEVVNGGGWWLVHVVQHCQCDNDNKRRTDISMSS